jgi:hypothetical protein
MARERLGNLNVPVTEQLRNAIHEAVRRESVEARLDITVSNYVRRLCQLDLEQRGLWPWRPEYAEGATGRKARAA